jgi:hypothetical protein
MTMVDELLCSAARLRARIRAALAVTAISVLVAACAAAPARLNAGADPADPDARVASVAYRPTLDGYASQRPVGPAPWRERNDKVAPGAKR